MARKTILVVEDDEDIRSQLTMALEGEGYAVNVAENGRSALDHLLALPDASLPGCIILDLMMPEMNGAVFMETISTGHPRLRAVPILVATARGSSGNPLPIPEGVRRIQKPFDLDELFGLVEGFCG